MAAPVKPKLSLSMIKNAVIIDGDSSMLSLVGNYLTSAKIGGLQKFNSGDQAYTYLQENPCDLVILDWKMKNPTGLALYEKIRALENAIKLPIVLISGVVTANDIQIAQVDKFAKFVVKPFAEEVFLSSISKLVGMQASSAQNKTTQASTSSTASSANNQKNESTKIGSSQQPQSNNMQIIRNGSNSNSDQGLVIVEGSQGKGGLGLQVDKGNRVSGNGTQIFDQEGPGAGFNAKQSGPDQGKEFSAVQKREQGQDFDITMKSERSGGDFSAEQKAFKSSGFEANQEGAGQGSSMNGRFSENGSQGDFEARGENPGSGAGFNKKFENNEDSRGNFDGQFARDSRPDGADIESPSKGVSSNFGELLRRKNEKKKEMEEQQRRAAAGSNNEINNEPSGEFAARNPENPGMGGTEGERAENRATSEEGVENNPTEGRKTQNAAREEPQATKSANSYDLDMGAGETEEPAREAEYNEVTTAPRFENNLDLGEATVETSIPEVVVERPRKVLCQAAVMGTKVDVYMPLDVLVVDHDVTQQNLIAKNLKDLGSDKVLCLSESPTAWDRIQSEKFDLIIIDWKLKGISGLALYSRIRERPETAVTPVMVMSGFVHKEDFRLLGESHYTKFLEKPIKQKDFEEVLRDTLTESATHTKITSMIGNLIDKMNGDSKKIVNLIEGLLKNIAKPFIFVLCAGEHLLNKGDLDNAEKVLRIAQRIDGGNVTVLTELSKIYHRTGRSDLAIVMLSKANVMSPDCVERLCLMGEIGLTVQDPERARKYFEATLKIDKDNAKANAGMVLAKNLKEANMPQGGGKSVSHTLASSLNAVAVSYVKNSEFAKAISQYQSAMCFVYDSDTISRLQFNLGMAHLRNKKIDEANKWLSVSAQNASPEFTKSATVLDKLQKFIEQNGGSNNLDSNGLADEFIEKNYEMVEEQSAARVVKIGNSGQIIDGSKKSVKVAS